MKFLLDAWKGISYRVRTWRLVRPLRVPKMPMKEVLRRLGEIAIVDVREPEEYDVSHLPGALHIPFKKIKADPSVLDPVPKNRTVVTYCTVGYRSGVVANLLKEKGHKDVYNLKGSLIHWFNRGGPVVQGDREVNRIHPFNEKWAYFITRSD
jgi:rhodanese-related sulfurtransferase